MSARRKSKTKPHRQVETVGRATPERLAKPFTDARTGEDRVQRVTDAPLGWLASRGFLDRDDAYRNRLLAEAGERYRWHWYSSGLSPIKATDPTRPSNIGAGTADRLPATERQAWHRQAYRDGEMGMGPFLSIIVNAVVFEERGLEDIGRQVSGYTNRVQARAIAHNRLVEGLRILAIEYGLLTRS